MTLAQEMFPMYCRTCGLVKMLHINPPLTCKCGETDFAYLKATTRGDGSIVFYGAVENDIKRNRSRRKAKAQSQEGGRSSD